MSKKTKTKNNVDEAKGRVTESVGVAVGDPEMVKTGKAEQSHAKFEKAKESLVDAVDNIKGALNKGR